MSAPAPIPFRWDGEAMVPLPGHTKRADREYVIGEVYHLVPHEQRSAASHAHYFAALSDIWQSLPEAMADRFASPEHLRRWCLIKAGYRDERTIVASSKAEATRLAAFVRPMDEFAVVVIHEATVTVMTAKSQSYRAMGKKDFGESKQAVIEIAAGMVGLSPEMAAQHARRAA